MTLDEFNRLLATLPPATTIDEFREQTMRLAPVLNFGDIELLADITDDVEIHRDSRGPLCVDVFRPAQVSREQVLPVMLFVHGGGWITGSTKSYRRLAARMAGMGIVVVSVEYRLAPESPYPGPVDDVMTTLRWIGSHAAGFGGAADQVVIVGDSCGANIAAGACVRARSDGSLPRIVAAGFIYGVFDLVALWAGATSAPAIGLLSARGIRLMLESYLGTPFDRAGMLMGAPELSPITEIESLPPSFILCGTVDPLLDQSLSLARAFKMRGVTHKLCVCDELPHGFAQVEFHAGTVPAIQNMCEWLHAQVR